MSKFIIACGGTGGHLVPGIAVGQALIRAGHQVKFIISKKAVDKIITNKYKDLDFEVSPGIALSFKPIQFVKFVIELVRGIKFGVKIIKNYNPELIMSFGGFSSLGIALSAGILKKTLVLHEANRKAGKATKLLSNFAQRIYVPYGVKIPRKKSGQVKYAGYPIREEIKALPKDIARQKLGFNEEDKLLLILGGSQGAQALNDWVDHNSDNLALHNINILCVTGPNKANYQNRQKRLPNGKIIKTIFMEFCEDMATAMSSSDIVIARAGAGSIAEIARCKVPSIIVPYPYATDNHQDENAKCFEMQGACIMLKQEKLNSLFEEIIELINNEKLVELMKKNMEIVDEQNNVDFIVSDLSEIASKGSKK